MSTTTYVFCEKIRKLSLLVCKKKKKKKKKKKVSYLQQWINIFIHLHSSYSMETNSKHLSVAML